MKLLLLLTPLLCFADIYDVLTIGSFKGYNKDGECNVVVITSNEVASAYRITSRNCDNGKCASFRGAEKPILGGGCTKHISENPYEIHLSNGMDPQGPPLFCASAFKPGGIRVLFYGAEKKVEILDGDGSLKADCTI